MAFLLLALLVTLGDAIYELHPDDFTAEGAPRREVFKGKSRLFVDFSLSTNADDFHEVFKRVEDRRSAAKEHDAKDMRLARLDCARHLGYCKAIHKMTPWSALRLYFGPDSNYVYFPLAAARPPQPKGAPPVPKDHAINTAAQLMHAFGATPRIGQAKTAIEGWMDMQRKEAKANFILPVEPVRKERKKMSARVKDWMKSLVYGKEAPPPDPSTRFGQTWAREQRFAKARADKIMTTNLTGSVTEDIVQQRAEAALRSAATNETAPLQWEAAMMGAGLDLLLHLNSTNYKTLLAPVAHAEGAPDTPRQVFLLYVGSWQECQAEKEEMRYALSYLREMAWGLNTLALVNCDLFKEPCIDAGVTSYCTASHFTTRNADKTVLGGLKTGIPMNPDQFKGQFPGTKIRDMVIDELPKDIRRLTRADVNKIEADRAASIAKVAEAKAKQAAPPPSPSFNPEDFDPQTIDMLRQAVAQQIKEVNEPGGPLDGAMKERAFKAMAKGGGLGLGLGSNGKKPPKGAKPGPQGVKTAVPEL